MPKNQYIWKQPLIHLYNNISYYYISETSRIHFIQSFEIKQINGIIITENFYVPDLISLLIQLKKKAYNFCLWLIRLWGKNESWLLGKIISPAASSILWYSFHSFDFSFPPYLLKTFIWVWGLPFCVNCSLPAHPNYTQLPCSRSRPCI